MPCMMLQYQRYIFRQCCFVLGMTLLGLTAILWLMQTLRLVDFIVNQGIPVALFLKLSGLLLPSMIMLVMPIALSIAIVFLYHKLRSDSELVVLQSSGLSRMQLASPALIVALLAVLISLLISAVVLPLSTREFRDMQHFLRNNYVSVLLQDGVFSTPVDGLTVYVRERVGEQTFRGVMVHDNRIPTSPVTMMAEKANLENTADGPQFLLFQGNRQELKNGALSFLQFDSYVLDIAVYTKGGGARKMDTEERGITELLFSAPESYESDKEYRKALADGHQRVIWPLLPFSLALGILGLMLSGEFNRRQGWQRNMVSMCLVVAIIVAMVAMRGLIARYAWMVPVAYVVALLPVVLGVLTLWPKKLRLNRPNHMRLS